MQYGLCSVVNCDQRIEDAWNTLFSYVMDLLKFGIRLQIAEEKLCIKKQEVTKSDVVTTNSKRRNKVDVRKKRNETGAGCSKADKSDVVATNVKKRNKTDGSVIITDLD